MLPDIDMHGTYFMLLLSLCPVVFKEGGTSSPSAWSGWSRCSVSCGVGIRTRLHACALEANPCPQGMYDVGYCRKNCDVKGNNGNKAEHGRKAKSQFFRNISNGKRDGWSPCSTTCGIGIQLRKRKCHKRACATQPFNLRVCVGQSTECSKGLILKAEQKHNALVNQKKTQLYRRLGFASLFIVGFACALFFVTVLLQLRNRTPTPSEQLRGSLE